MTTPLPENYTNDPTRPAPTGATYELPATGPRGLNTITGRINAHQTAIDGLAAAGGASLATTTHAAASKATPVDADELGITDSAASFGWKRVTFANLKATLKTYFDSLATTLTNKTISAANNTLTGIGVSALGGFTGTPSSTTYARGDGTWATPAGGGGSGDVVGPASATDNAITRFDATTGKLVQSSTVTVSDTGVVAGASVSLASNTVTGTVAQFNTALSAADFVTTDLTTVAGFGFVSNDSGLSPNSSTLLPTQAAVKAYVDAAIAAALGGGGSAFTNDGTGLYTIGAGADVTDDGTGLYTIGGTSGLTNDGTGLYSIP